jgi:hypothetical protein
MKSAPVVGIEGAMGGTLLSTPVTGDDVIGDGYVSLRVVAVSGEPIVSS